MAYLALDPVSAAIFTTLNVAAVTDLATGGVSDSPLRNATPPFVWYEVEKREARGFGTGGLPEVTLRVHTFTNYEGMITAQAINQQVITLLRDAALTVTGYTQAGRVFYDETITLPNELLNGVAVHEIVSLFRIYVEE